MHNSESDCERICLPIVIPSSLTSDGRVPSTRPVRDWLSRRTIVRMSDDLSPTERTRELLALAYREANRFNHDWVGVEHVLLAITRQPGTIAALALESLGITLNDIRAQIEDVLAAGEKTQIGTIILAPRMHEVLRLAREQARSRGHRHMGTEHVLLGILTEGHSQAARKLVGTGVSREVVEARLDDLLFEHGREL